MAAFLSSIASGFRSQSSSFPSDQVRKALLHFPELADAEPEEEDGDSHADAEGTGVEGGIAAEDAPAEAVDDPDHRVEGVEQLPLLQNNGGGKADG